MMGRSEEASPGSRPESGWREVESEHAALRIRGERLERRLEEIAEAGPEPDVRRLLEEFHDRLLEHLAAEEHKGVLERAAQLEPRFDQRVQRLLAEHEELRKRARELLASVAALGWSEVHRCFAEFRRVLRSHEQAENEVMQRAYYEDMGGPG